MKEVIDSTAHADKGYMYADDFVKPLYAQTEPQDGMTGQDSLYWVSEWGIDDRAEALLDWLDGVERQGLRRSSFHVEEIREDLASFRKLRPDSCTEEEVCVLLGRLEWRLTSAYARFAYGQRYGYTKPNAIFNKLLFDKSANSYRRIFDHEIDTPTDSLMKVAIEGVADVASLNDFLAAQQPSDSLYAQLAQEYVRAKKAGETRRAELCRINLERARWRYPRPQHTGKYVWVNLSEQMLTAVDADHGKRLRMKVCFGNQSHKTPLLTSQINRLELNPYWVIPPSIVKNEIAPAHTGDAAYFSRNRYVAIHKETKAEVSPASLTRSDLLSGRYTLRQERGAGNALGRLIFRFPNRFSVYLHDTSSPGAFSKSTRTVSHGCVRVQKPLDLAIFLMDNPTDKLIDKIRVAIDKAPLTQEGRQYKETTAPDKYMKSHSFKPAIPVFLDYYTLYPDSTGKLTEHSDLYNYDKEVAKALDAF
ncbi:MAG: L,D-transpeptidase family protein [Bacteroidales bacterium]|nr:L,D-transpeptidase family protein [Candidatus Physcousia equi]